ncbi:MULTISPECIES: hypothetical protein [Pseudarthrobacter]|uniref:Uncharacterized protein n=1 Tax=Pseudarthrobacter niigatensis TaxID=369935 RepID=A0AAJ1SUF1_9MICC|nr:hypothetical protein [Pseudarthrobacter niigatensis]MDQ0145973.1 hypothetical protein [Pseudarthrobacter niigatensis]MDQ0266299.1 hypothetical protein [Pseudarthrobacter niigatensis]
MGKYGGSYDARYSRRELRRRRLRATSYVGLAFLAVGTVAVVLAALGR